MGMTTTCSLVNSIVVFIVFLDSLAGGIEFCGFFKSDALILSWLGCIFHYKMI